MLEYFPKDVESCNCSHNKITSLKGCPEKINGSFFCSYNDLISLEYCPKFIRNSFSCYGNSNISSIEDYPLSIIKGTIPNASKFTKISKLIKENEDLFIPLLDNKKAFHQMAMRLDPSLIPEYINIPPPSKNSNLLL